jgi:flagellar basal body rod protein FlgB
MLSFDGLWETNVIRGLLGATSVKMLRGELDSSMARTREIANRVANASNDQRASFESVLDDALQSDTVDLEVEMVRLADEQIRYEAMGKMLQKVYSQVRASLRSS